MLRYGRDNKNAATGILERSRSLFSVHFSKYHSLGFLRGAMLRVQNLVRQGWIIDYLAGVLQIELNGYNP